MMKVAVNYTIFAIVATVANISAQDISLRAYDGGHGVALSVLVGTAVGLLVKYVLDKKYIFRYQVVNAAHDTRTFVLYALMGLVTTAIFWGFEFGFHLAFNTKAMRYLGGVIGLALGYYLKYWLDKRFVFVVPGAAEGRPWS
jgi:putative flippase GtrA